MGNCSSTSNCNPCGPDFSAINQLATKAGAYARQANTYATNAENSWLEFNALYLGAFAVAPTVDNEGDPLQTGALYWNTGSNTMFVWNGTIWVAADFNEFTPFLATGTTFSRNLVTRFVDVVNVKDFGAVGDGTDATAAFNLAATAANNQKSIFVPSGTYLISSALTVAGEWIIDIGATITGLPPLGDGQLPIVTINDLSRLSGRIIRIENTPYGAGIQIGDPDPWLERFFRPSAQSRAELSVLSPYGQIAITGASKMGDNPIATGTDMACIGGNFYAINDRPPQPGEFTTAYGFYAEARRRLGGGAAFGGEIDIANQDPVVPLDPNSPLSVAGYTGGLLIASGSGLPPAETYPASFGLTFSNNGDSFYRGIVFNDFCLDATGPLEAISMPITYKIAWYASNSPISTLDQREHLRKINTETAFFGVVDINDRTRNSGTSESLDTIYENTSNGFVSGVRYQGSSYRVLQRSNFVGGNARFSNDLISRNSDGTNAEVTLNGIANNTFAPATDDSISLGTGAFRWSVVYSATPAINTSDEREKTFLEIEEAEKLAAIEIKRNLRKFKFNSAIEKKGEGARIHFGVSAQQVGDIMKSHGLDPNKYGFYCYDEWEKVPEIKNENNEIIQQSKPSGNRYGIRYEELLSFIATL